MTVSAAGRPPGTGAGGVRYLFLLYGDPAGEADLTAEQRRAVVGGHVALGRELAAAGTLHLAEALGDGVRVLHTDGTVTGRSRRPRNSSAACTSWTARAPARRWRWPGGCRPAPA